MCDSCAGRSSDCSRGVCQAEGKKGAALYQALQEGRRPGLRGCDSLGRQESGKIEHESVAEKEAPKKVKVQWGEFGGGYWPGQSIRSCNEL